VRRAATAAARPMGAFSTGVTVDWGLSERPARVDCGLSYTTGQATVAQSVIVACTFETQQLLHLGTSREWTEQMQRRFYCVLTRRSK